MARRPGTDGTPRQSPRFLLLYAFAWAGGAIAYTPFLTLLLPLRFTELAGNQDIHWLARCTTVGAVAASVAGIGWGWASDRWPQAGKRQRVLWSAAGLVATVGASIAIVGAQTPLTLLVAVACWQVALNLMLAPLSAYAADSVGEQQQGILGGMLSLAPAIAALSIIGISLVPASLADRMALIMLIVTIAFLPLLTMRAVHAIGGNELSARNVETIIYDRRTLKLLWLARLFVQVAEGLLFVFIFYFLRSVSSGELSLRDYGLTSAGIQLLAIPVTFGIGRYSDRTGKRKFPLVLTIVATGSGLVGMALLGGWWPIVASYALFAVGSNSFLALNSAFSMRALPNARHFGRDLGIFNLTNTLPALTTPILAALIIGQYGYQALLGLLAATMLIPVTIIFRLRLA